MNATEYRKMCIDCKHFDKMPGNLYGICIIDSYIDGDDDFELQWLPFDADPCDRFKEVEPHRPLLEYILPQET